jgi:hypothetical protein
LNNGNRRGRWGWRKRRHKRRANKVGTEGGWGGLVNGSGDRGLIPIGGIGKMDDMVYTGFNLNFDEGRSVESGSRGMGRGTELHGYIRARTWETVHHVFTSTEFPR